MEVVEDDDSSWAPTEMSDEEMGSVSSSTFSRNNEEDAEDEDEVSSSDLDEFIMSTSQSGALSRQRKRSKKSSAGQPSKLKKKKKKKRRQTLATPLGRVSQEVRDLLGQGHNAFLKRDYEGAIILLEEAIRLAPGVADPFVTLGAIYEEIGDPKRSLEALLVAVHLTPGDCELWKRVAVMSQTVGNIEQAIYCLKRCVKAVNGNRSAEEPFLRDLANVYVQAGKFAEAAPILAKLFPIAKSDEESVELGTLLAKSLYNINEKSEAMKVLEKLAPLAPDANIINMLAEVYLDTREWGRCFSLLTGVLDMDHLQDPEKCPVDLVAKLALASAPNFSRLKEICEKCVLCVLATPVVTHSDLYLAVADGLIANNLIDLALSLLNPALLAFQEPAILAGIRARTGKCLFAQGKYSEASILLEEFVFFEKSQSRKPDPDSLVMLADAWRQTGRESEAGQLLLHSLNYEDLVACRTLPTATSTTQRRQWLETLLLLLESHSAAALVNEPALEHIRRRFADMYLQLLSDCELDAQRISRHRLTEVSGITDNGAAPPAWRVRKELDLESVEDRLGSEKFVALVLAGAEVCAAAGKAKETVELLEVIVHNKRKKWAQQGSEEGTRFIECIENLSFKIALSTHGLLSKVSTKYLRQLAVEAIAKEDEASLEGHISQMTRLMFFTNFSAREILDQRSWLVRQACKTPNVFALCLMCAHMCVYSQNHRFASEEYMRAHRLRPDDPFPLLCLGASLLSLSMSRTTRDRQFTIAKAFSVLSEYARKRQGVLVGDFQGEIEYNFGRACHQLSLWTLADRHYRKALNVLTIENPLRRVVCYNLHLIRSRADQHSRDLLFASIIAS